jgi:hypothetical protein
MIKEKMDEKQENKIKEWKEEKRSSNPLGLKELNILTIITINPRQLFSDINSL